MAFCLLIWLMQKVAWVWGMWGGADAEVDAAVSSRFYSAIDFGIKTLKLEDTVDDNLLSLGKTYHIVRFIENSEDIFVYFAWP